MKIKRELVIIIITIASFAIFTSYMSQYLKPDPVTMQMSIIKEMMGQGKSIAVICSAIGGTWIEERNRCINYPNDAIDEICEALGGTIKTSSGENLPMEIRWCEIAT